MPTYVPPKKNTAFIFYTALTQQADTRLLKSTPTLASGDFKVSIDGGTLNNLATLPTNTPASSVMLKVSLSSSEMNGDNITVVCIDAAGAEWCDKVINIQTSARQVEDLAYPATTGRSMVVDLAGLVDANMVKAGPTGTGTAQTTGDIFARIGAPTGASVSADIAAVASQVSNIAVTGAALNTTAASETLTTGTDTGGLANASTLDGTYDTWTAAGGVIDGYYQFNLSGTTGAVGVGATWNGYLVGAVNTLRVYAYNWGGAVWDQIGSIVGITGTIVGSQEFEITSAHTGTGGNLGLVRIRFQNTGLVAGVLNTDRILLGYAVVITLPANFSALVISGAGTVNSNVLQWNTVNVATVNTAGVPVVDTREVMRVGTAQATGNTTTQIKLDAGASANDNQYLGDLIEIISGTGAPEAGVCTGYSGSTKVAIIFPAWSTAPDNTSVFLIRSALADTVLWLGAGIATPDVGGYPKISALDSQSMGNGLAQAGGTSTITLAASDTAPDNYYVGTRLRIWQGAGIGQAKNIIGNVFSTKVVTVDRPWGVVPNNTSRYSIESADEPLLDASGFVTVKGVRPQKNVALPNFEFVMVDARGVGVPGLAITVTRSKDKGAYAAADNAGSITDVGGGTYGMDLTANDLNAGVVTFHFTASGASDKWITMVMQT